MGWYLVFLAAILIPYLHKNSESSRTVYFLSEKISTVLTESVRFLPCVPARVHLFHFLHACCVQVILFKPPLLLTVCNTGEFLLSPLGLFFLLHDGEMKGWG